MTLTIELEMYMCGTAKEVSALAETLTALRRKDGTLGDHRQHAMARTHETSEAALLEINDLFATEVDHPRVLEVRFDDDPEVGQALQAGGMECYLTLYCDQIPTRDIQHLSSAFPHVYFHCAARISDENAWPGSPEDEWAGIEAEAVCVGGNWE